MDNIMKLRMPLGPLSFRDPRRGQATLSLVFLVGGIVILIGVTLSVLVISLINSGYGFQAANRALARASRPVAAPATRTRCARPGTPPR